MMASFLPQPEEGARKHAHLHNALHYQRARLEGEGGPVSGLMVRDAPQPPRDEGDFFLWAAALLTMRIVELAAG